MWIAILFISAVSLGFIGVAVYNSVRIFSCKKLVDGYCMDKRKQKAFRGWDYFCTFSYRYEGKDYYRETKLGVTPKLYNYLQQGEDYKIYINENKPGMFVVERKITSNEITLFVGGLIIAVFPIFMFWFILM